MAFIRRIKKSSGVYLAKVETFREDGKVKQKVIEYLGKEVDGKPSKKVYSDKIEVTKVKQYYDLFVIDALAKELSLEDLLGEYAKPLLILIYSHLVERKSINKIPKWLDQTDLFEILQIEKISTKQLYSALDYLNTLDIEQIQNNIKAKWEKYEDIKKMLVLDITDTYFNGSKASWKSRKGKDGKYDKLIQIALAVTFNKGLPLFHKIYEGNINNVKIFQDMLADIRCGAFKGLIVDRGMSSKENIGELNKLGLEGILGVRLHKGLQNEFVDKIDREEIYSKSNQVKLKNTKVYIQSFPSMSGKIIVVYNPVLEVAKREQHIERNKDPKRAKYLGYSLIYHNTKMNDKSVVKKYFEKDIVERCFKQIKGLLSLRPIRVWLLEHIEAHIKICYLSFCILSLLAVKLSKLKITPVDALEQLKTAYKVSLEDKSSNTSWEKTVCLTKSQQEIINAVCSV